MKYKFELEKGIIFHVLIIFDDKKKRKSFVLRTRKSCFTTDMFSSFFLTFYILLKIFSFKIFFAKLRI